MIVQDLWSFDPQKKRELSFDWLSIFLRLFVFGGTFFLTLFLIDAFYHMLSLGGMTLLQYALLFFFCLNIFWLSLCFMTGLTGFLVYCLKIPDTIIKCVDIDDIASIKGRTAILIPTYNENPEQIFGTALAVDASLKKLGFQNNFDIFILSDTTNPDIWVQEEAAFSGAQEHFKYGRTLHYRRRRKNIAKKAGNIGEWCDNWHARYDYMVIFDADSLMTGEAIATLANAMDRYDDMALIQSVPQCINRNTLFARLQQFSGQAYGRLMASGLSFWHRGDGNFWGHNAVLRVKAFYENAGLPTLSGSPPFGGLILSHDFVEAAFLRRAGWRVSMIPNLKGSYEESPRSLLDYAQRDRRWCQGNLQHSRLLLARGLYWLSRIHLIMGIMAYLSTLFWAIFLTIGIMISLQAHFGEKDYFGDEVALFPTWPRQDSEYAVGLLILTAALLLLPKLFGYITIMLNKAQRQDFGGGLALTLSVLLETLISALLAPVMMMLQSKAIYDIISGKDSGWKPQTRNDGSMPVVDILRAHASHMIVGLLLAILCYIISINLLLWMSPLLLGLLLSGPLSLLTSYRALGGLARRCKLFLIPEEQLEPEIVKLARHYSEVIKKHITGEEALMHLAQNPELRNLHTQLLPDHIRQSASDIDVDLVLARAKLEASTSLEELIMHLTPSEKTALLSDSNSVTQLMTLFEAANTAEQTLEVPKTSVHTGT
ncbi:MAG: glucans biosynthesis glucosyltransferase MdoH [Pseudomonadota bacterium]